MPGLELPDGNHFTPCEVQTLRLLLQGLTAQEVADAFCLSRRTIQFHVQNVYRKLEVNNLLRARRRLRELGLLALLEDEYRTSDHENATGAGQAGDSLSRVGA